MSNNYQNCKKCGTRNFIDDKQCGVCSTKLDNIVETNEVKSETKPDFISLFLKIFLIVGLIFSVYAFFIYKDKPQLDKRNLSSNTGQEYGSIESISAAEYTLLRTELNNKRAFNIQVRISKKISNSELIATAEKVKKDINAVSNLGVIFFLLPEMKINDGAWAAVDFDPEIKVRIIGKSTEDENLIKSNINNIKDYYGIWQDNSIAGSGDVLIRIRKDKEEGYVFEYISSTDPKPSELASPLNKTTKNGKTVFVEKEGDQFFVVEKNGNLSIYDNVGFVATYIRLK